MVTRLAPEQRRRLSRTPLTLPVLGLGTAPIGNLYRPVCDAQARAAVVHSLTLGIDYLDTAPHYGFGLSERRVGAALDAQPVVLSTKVGRSLVEYQPAPGQPTPALRFGFAEAEPSTPVFDYGYHAVQRQLDQSAERLGRLPDIVYAHDLGPTTHGADDAAYWHQFCSGGYRALCERKAAGDIQAIGLGVNEVAVCERALDALDLDVLLLAGRYTLLEQSALARLLPRCQEQSVSVVIGGPFNSGVLATAGRPDGPHYYNYAPAPEWALRRVRALDAVCTEYQVPLAAAALQFPAAHPAVVSVIAGCASADEVQQARQWMDWAIPAELWVSLKSRGLLAALAPCPDW